jgi:hypothetical protein
VIEMTALIDKQELDGNALVYLPRYVAPNDELFDHSDAEIEHEFHFRPAANASDAVTGRRQGSEDFASSPCLRFANAGLFRPIATDRDIGSWPVFIEFIPHRQRHIERQRNNQTGE